MFRREHEDVVQPEAVPPVRFEAIWRASTPPLLVRRLLLALLEQAASDLRFFRFQRRPEARRKYLEIRQWVMSDDRSHPFSFVNICAALKLSPDALRSIMVGTAQPPSPSVDQ